MAAALVVAERTGRAIRKPSTDALLSHAGSQIGHGWAFGLNEFLDQTGATIGPLLMALILYFHGGYHKAFALLLIPALLCLGAVTVARIYYPRPHELEKREPVKLEGKGFSKTYWLYVVAGALIAAGFADFSLIAFHFQKTGSVGQSLVPVFYSAAMVTSAIAALIFGKLLDKIGLPAVLAAFFLGAFFAPCVFLGGFGFALAGMILWGVGMGAQDALLKAMVAARRAAAKARHRLRRFRHRIRRCLVRRQRGDGSALRPIGSGRRDSFRRAATGRVAGVCSGAAGRKMISSLWRYWTFQASAGMIEVP